MDEAEEELLALKAILEDSFEFVGRSGRMAIDVQADSVEIHSENNEAIKIQHLPPITLKFVLPEEYPQKAGPILTAECKWLTFQQMDRLMFITKSMWQSGSVVLYDCFVYLRDHCLDALDRTPEGDIVVPNEELLHELIEFDRLTRSESFRHRLQCCEICFLDLSGEEFVRIADCDHRFCRDCVREYCELRIRTAGGSPILCPDDSCESVIPHHRLRETVRHELFEMYDKAVLNSFLSELPALVWCPNKSCDHPAEVVDGNLAECPSCGMPFCIKCNRLYHGPNDCWEEFLAKMQEESFVRTGNIISDFPINAQLMRFFRSNAAKLGVDAAWKLCISLAKRVFADMSNRSRRDLGVKYVGATAEVKDHYDTMYGSPFMEWLRFDPEDPDGFDVFVAAVCRSEDKRFAALRGLLVLMQEVRQCPHCQVPIQKNGGCSHMFCTKCNRSFDWEKDTKVRRQTTAPRN